MPTSLITRITDGPGVDTVKESPLTNVEVDTNFITLAENKLERENNLSDVIDPGAARASLSVPDRDGTGAFGSWNISVSGNAGTATSLQNIRAINGVGFDGSADITISAASPETLIFGTGLSSSDNYDGSVERIVAVDPNDVVTTTGNQTISGTKTFNSAIEIETQATLANHAVVGSRTITSGSGLIGGGDLTTDLTLEVDDTLVVITSDVNQVIDGTKSFSKAVELGLPGTLTNHAVRADRSVLSGDGLEGGGNLTDNRELSVDNTVIRTIGNQTLGGVKTFTNPPVLSNPSTSINEAVRSDREISAGDGISGGGNLTSNLTLSVDGTVIRTTGNQTLGGTKTFSQAVILNTQGSTASEALAAGRTINAGDGLSGGGDLTTDRAFSVDGTVVRTSRNLIAGDGLNGGGDLTANRTFSLDNTVVRTSGSQSIGGAKTFTDGATFSSTVGFNGQTTFADPIELASPTTNTTHAVRADRTISAGDGLNGGGDFTANRTFSVDNTVVRTSGDFTLSGEIVFSDNVVLSSEGTAFNNPVRADRQVIAGDGLNGGGDLTTDQTISVDATVVRDPNTVVRTTRQVTAGDGLSGGGPLNDNISLSVDDTVPRGAVDVPLRETYVLTIGQNIQSDSNSEFTESDYILDPDYDDLIIGETVLGLASGATAIVQDTIVTDNSAQIIVLMIQGEFDESGEVIQGQESLVEVDIESSELGVSIVTQDIHATGEVIDYIPTDVNNVENVTDIPNALDKVLAIGGKLFDWTDEHIERKRDEFRVESDDVGADGYFIQKSDFGVIAQDVQNVFPEGVREKDNGELAVDYRKLFALSFAAIKELNDKIV